MRQAIVELEEGLGKLPSCSTTCNRHRKPGPGELSTSELRSLERNTQYQLARALRSQGESYPVESTNRANSLTQAGELLRVLAQGDVEDPLTWPARLDATTCYRLLGHLEAATRRLDQLDEESPPPGTVLRARAERMRMALAEDQVGEALALVEKGRMVDGLIAADLDLATLEVYLAAWRAAIDAGEKSQASAWQEKAAAVVRDIERDHGPYWRRRGESLFAEQIAANPGTTDIGVLAQAAEGFYRAGQPDEALAAFDRAVREAHAAGQDAKAFELGYAAAAIEQERKNYAAAAERYRQAAIASPGNPQAAAAHLMAIYDQGQLARGGAAEPLAHYTKLLEEHLETWPKDETTDRAICGSGGPPARSAVAASHGAVRRDSTGNRREAPRPPWGWHAPIANCWANCAGGQVDHGSGQCRRRNTTGGQRSEANRAQRVERRTARGRAGDLWHLA